MPPAVVHFLAKYQAPLALVMLVLLALDILGVIPMPASIEFALVAGATALGVQRPSEAALKLAAEVGPYPGGGIPVAAFLGGLAAAVAALPKAPEDPEGKPAVDVIDVRSPALEDDTTDTGDIEPEASFPEDLGG